MNSLISENSTAIIDQSGNQRIDFFTEKCKIDVYYFLEKKDVSFVATIESAKELTYHTKEPNLFSINNNSITSAALNNGQEYVLSDGSLIKKELNPDGYPVTIIANTEETKTFQTPLWNGSFSYRRIIRKIEKNKRGYADKSNLELAHNLQEKKENFFLLINDNDQIKQAENFEGFKYLRPLGVLVWMVKDNYITRQKAVWAYEKMKKEDPGGAIKGVNFKDIYKKLR